MAMIEITPGISIGDDEIEYRFKRAPGPGGQNVNKVETAVELRFNLAASPNLPDGVKARMVRLAGRRLTKDGVIVISAERFRSQERNREDALNRLIEMIREATKVPKYRVPTRPGRAAKQRRLDAKQRRGTVKKARGRVKDAE